MNDHLLQYVPAITLERKLAGDIYDRFPRSEWQHTYCVEYELLKETSKNETYRISHHWFVVNKANPSEHEYLYTSSTESSGKRFLVVGGPLAGYKASRFRVSDAYIAFNNAGRSSQTMIWVHESLLND